MVDYTSAKEEYYAEMVAELGEEALISLKGIPGDYQ